MPNFHRLRYRLVIFSILYDNCFHLKEWIEFHRLVGVEHFFLYGTTEQIGMLSGLSHYLESGELSIICWNQSFTESLIYNHCVAHCLPLTEWLVHLTLNDFLFSDNTSDLRLTLEAHSEIAVLPVQCTIYGGEEIDNKPLLIERYIEFFPIKGPCYSFIVNTKLLSCLPDTSSLNASASSTQHSNAYITIRSLAREIIGGGQKSNLLINRYTPRNDKGRALSASSEQLNSVCSTNNQGHLRSRGKVDLRIQDYANKLYQRLNIGVRPEFQLAKVRSEAVDRYRSRNQNLTIHQRATPCEFAVVGMQRSGNHIIIQWLLHGLSGNWIFLNDVVISQNPFTSFHRFEAKGYTRDDFSDLSNLDNRSAFTGSLVYSYEDYAPATVGRWMHCIGQYLPNCGTRTTILILRDPYNLFASRLHGEENNRPYRIPFDRRHAWLVRERWIECALEYIGQTSYLQNLVVVDYNRFVSSQNYRRWLAAALRITSTERVLEYVPKYGGGSSFDGHHFDGKARAMKVLDRWQHYSAHLLYREILADSRIRSLANLIFDPFPKPDW